MKIEIKHAEKHAAVARPTNFLPGCIYGTGSDSDDYFDLYVLRNKDNHITAVFETEEDNSPEVVTLNAIHLEGSPATYKLLGKFSMELIELP